MICLRFCIFLAMIVYDNPVATYIITFDPFSAFVVEFGPLSNISVFGSVKNKYICPCAPQSPLP